MTFKTSLRTLIDNPLLIAELKWEVISRILQRAKEIFKDEGYFLEFDIDLMEEEVYVIGDIHGSLETLMKIIEILNKKQPKLVIFLGDIVDRGPQQIECMIILLALKILSPERIKILRGNHETLEMNEAYGFYFECIQAFKKRKYFIEFLSLYDFLPICATINNTILCLHGGIPQDVDFLKKLKGLKIENLTDEIIKSIDESFFQIMWNDPDPDMKGFSQNFRGHGIKYFGEDAFDEFMSANNLKYLIRAHEVFPEGYRWFFNNRLLSIFTSANYRGRSFPNLAAYAKIKKGKIIPKIIKLPLD